MSKTSVKILLSLALVAVFAFSAVIPALAAAPCPGCVDQGKLVVRNKSSEPMYISLVGKYETYSLTVAPGTTKNFSIYVGTYRYSVTGCVDHKASGSYYQGKAAYTFVQPVCGFPKGEKTDGDKRYLNLGTSPAKLVAVTIKNPLSVGTQVTLTASGGIRHSFYLPAGSSKSATIERADYRVACSACGTSESWKVREGTEIEGSVRGDVYVVPCP